MEGMTVSQYLAQEVGYKPSDKALSASDREQLKAWAIEEATARGIAIR